MKKINGKKRWPTQVKKFMGGLMTPRELHIALGVRRPCLGCGRPASTRIRTLAPIKDLLAHAPDLLGALMVNSPTPGVVPTIPTKFGDLAVISDVGTCDRCRPAAERAAAHPSRRIPRALRESLLVEILEPPENLNPVSAQVTETVETAVRNMAKTETIAPAKTDETVCETKTTVKE